MSCQRASREGMNASGLAPGSLLTKALGPRRPASRRSGDRSRRGIDVGKFWLTFASH
jgi:hypothetical protein